MKLSKIEYFYYPFYAFFTVMMFSYMNLDTQNFNMTFWLSFNLLFAVASILFLIIEFFLYFKEKKLHYILNIVLSLFLLVVIAIWTAVDFLQMFNVHNSFVDTMNADMKYANYAGLFACIVLIISCFVISFKDDHIQHLKEKANDKIAKQTN